MQSLKPAQNRPNLDDPGEMQFENNTEPSPPSTPISENAQVNTPTPTIDTCANVNNQRICKPPTWLKYYIV